MMFAAITGCFIILRKYAGRIYILFLNNLPFINDKGNIFYPRDLFENST